MHDTVKINTERSLIHVCAELAKSLPRNKSGRFQFPSSIRTQGVLQANELLRDMQGVETAVISGLYLIAIVKGSAGVWAAHKYDLTNAKPVAIPVSGSRGALSTAYFAMITEAAS